MFEKSDGVINTVDNSVKQFKECEFQQPREHKKRKINSNIASSNDSPSGPKQSANTVSQIPTDLIYYDSLTMTRINFRKKNFETPPVVLHRIINTNKLKSVIDKKLSIDDYVIAFGRNNNVSNPKRWRNIK